MKERGLISGLIALLIVSLFCAVLVALFFRVVPDANQNAFNGLVTALVSMVSGVIGYYFGSSRSAEHAQATIAAATPAAQPSAAEVATDTAKKS